jgi:hypothetical protein
MKKIAIGLCIMLMMIVTTGVAGASSIVYDFTGGSGQQALTYDFLGDDGLTITHVTATYDNIDQPVANVYRASGGIGASWSGDSNTNLDGNRDEYLTFTFDQNVTLLALHFGDAQGNDQFDLYVNGSGSGIPDNFDTVPGWITFSSTYNGSSFSIRSSDSDDSFLVSGMEVTATPEPATLLLMGVGIVGLIGGAARKKLKAKTVVKS